MKRTAVEIGWALMLAGALAVRTAVAGGGWATTHPLAGGTVALTNTQANSVWVPVAVLWRYPAATNAALTVERASQSNTFVLGVLALTNAAGAVWIPETDYPFGLETCLLCRVP